MLFRVIMTSTMCLLFAACAPRHGSIRDMPSAPAHWVDSIGDYAPDWADHGFSAASFSTPSDGWIAGRRFLLHVSSDRLTVTFIQGTHTWADDVAFSTPDSGWIVGSTITDHRSEGHLWRFQAGHWQAVALPQLWSDWGLTQVRVAPEGVVWVAGTVYEARAGEFHIPTKWRTLLLRYAGGVWTEQEVPDPSWLLADFCFHANGEGVFVGTQRSAKRLAALVARLRAGKWIEDSVPDSGKPISVLSHIACTSSGGPIAAGWKGDTTRSGDALVLRFDGQWSPLPLPEEYTRHLISALSGVSPDNFWLAVDCAGDATPCGPRFLHWTGEWEEVPAPILPEGRTTGYDIHDMQFVSADEGWAVGDDFGGPGLQHGVIMHYKDGRWRLRQWTWSMIDMPWFGLFGD